MARTTASAQTAFGAVYIKALRRSDLAEVGVAEGGVQIAIEIRAQAAVNVPALASYATAFADIARQLAKDSA